MENPFMKHVAPDKAMDLVRCIFRRCRELQQYPAVAAKGDEIITARLKEIEDQIVSADLMGEYETWRKRISGGVRR